MASDKEGLQVPRLFSNVLPILPPYLRWGGGTELGLTMHRLTATRDGHVFRRRRGVSCDVLRRCCGTRLEKEASQVFHNSKDAGLRHGSTSETPPEAIGFVLASTGGTPGVSSPSRLPDTGFPGLDQGSDTECVGRGEEEELEERGVVKASAAEVLLTKSGLAGGEEARSRALDSFCGAPECGADLRGRLPCTTRDSGIGGQEAKEEESSVLPAGCSRTLDIREARALKEPEPAAAAEKSSNTVRLEQDYFAFHESSEAMVYSTTPSSSSLASSSRREKTPEQDGGPFEESRLVNDPLFPFSRESRASSPEDSSRDPIRPGEGAEKMMIQNERKNLLLKGQGQSNGVSCAPVSATAEELSSYSPPTQREEAVLLVASASPEKENRQVKDQKQDLHSKRMRLLCRSRQEGEGRIGHGGSRGRSSHLYTSPSCVKNFIVGDGPKGEKKNLRGRDIHRGTGDNGAQEEDTAESRSESLSCVDFSSFFKKEEEVWNQTLEAFYLAGRSFFSSHSSRSVTMTNRNIRTVEKGNGGEGGMSAVMRRFPVFSGTDQDPHVLRQNASDEAGRPQDREAVEGWREQRKSHDQAHPGLVNTFSFSSFVSSFPAIVNLERRTEECCGVHGVVLDSRSACREEKIGAVISSALLSPTMQRHMRKVWFLRGERRRAEAGVDGAAAKRGRPRAAKDEREEEDPKTDSRGGAGYDHTTKNGRGRLLGCGEDSLGATRDEKRMSDAGDFPTGGRRRVRWGGSGDGEEEREQGEPALSCKTQEGRTKRTVTELCCGGACERCLLSLRETRDLDRRRERTGGQGLSCGRAIESQREQQGRRPLPGRQPGHQREESDAVCNKDAEERRKEKGRGLTCGHGGGEGGEEREGEVQESAPVEQGGGGAITSTQDEVMEEECECCRGSCPVGLALHRRLLRMSGKDSSGSQWISEKDSRAEGGVSGSVRSPWWCPCACCQVIQALLRMTTAYHPGRRAEDVFDGHMPSRLTRETSFVCLGPHSARPNLLCSCFLALPPFAQSSWEFDPPPSSLSFRSSALASGGLLCPRASSRLPPQSHVVRTPAFLSPQISNSSSPEIQLSFACTTDNSASCGTSFPVSDSGKSAVAESNDSSNDLVTPGPSSFLSRRTFFLGVMKKSVPAEVGLQGNRAPDEDDQNGLVCRWWLGEDGEEKQYHSDQHSLLYPDRAVQQQIIQGRGKRRGHGRKSSTERRRHVEKDLRLPRRTVKETTGHSGHGEFDVRRCLRVVQQCDFPFTSRATQPSLPPGLFKAWSPPLSFTRYTAPLTALGSGALPRALVF